MDRWINFGVSLFCCTIPETIFFTLITYIILKRYDMIDVHRIKNTLFCILLPVGISSIILDYSRWVLEVPKGIAKIYSLIILLGIIIFVIKKNTYEKIKRYGLKIFFSFIISYLIMGIIEIVYTSILLIIINLPFEVIQSSMLNYILSSIPARIIQIFIIAIIFIKRNSKIINTIHIIFKNKSLLIFSTTTLMFIIGILAFILKMILYNNILLPMNISEQLITVSILLFVLPCGILSWTYFFIHYLINKEREIVRIYSDNE